MTRMRIYRLKEERDRGDGGGGEDVKRGNDGVWDKMREKMEGKCDRLAVCVARSPLYLNKNPRPIFTFFPPQVNQFLKVSACSILD